MTVKDEAAGRTGKCPACGTTLIVPKPTPEPDEFALLDEPVPVAGPAPAPSRSTTTTSTTAPARGRSVTSSAGHDSGDLIDDEFRPSSGKGRVRFGAIGLGWDLLKEKLGTWVLAVLVFALAGFAINFATFLLAIPLAIGESLIVGNHAFKLSSIVTMILASAAQGILMGGLYRLALRQLDGHDIRVGDMFAVTDAALGLAVGMILVSLGMYLGFLLLVIPGLIFAGVAMFTLPLAADGRMSGVDALKRSWEALKGDWLNAALFHFAVSFVMISGVLLFGVGLLFTFPLYILSVAAQYRRSFAAGAKPRGKVVENPRQAALGVPADEQIEGRVPVGVWLLMAGGLATPVILFVAVTALIVVLYRAAAVPQRGPLVIQDGAFPNPGEIGDVLAKQAGPRFNPGPPGDRPPGQVGRPDRGFANPLAPGAKIDGVDKALAGLKGDVFVRGDSFRWLAAANPDDARRSEVLRALTPYFEDPKTVGDAEPALSRWATTESVPDLVGVLHSADNRVRHSAMQLLGKLGDARAAGRLAAALTDSRDRSDAARALTALGPRAQGEVSKYLNHEDRDVRTEAAAILRRISGDSPDLKATLALTDLKGPDDGARKRALATLAQLAGKVSERQSDVNLAVMAALGDREPSVRSAAARALGALGGPDEVPALIKALGDPERDVQREALNALAKLKDPKALGPVTICLADPAIRDHAVRALRDWGEDAEPEVLKGLRSPDPDTRKAVCQVLGAIGTQDAAVALRRATADSNKNVAGAARLALVSIESRQNAKQNKGRMMPRKKR